MVEEILKMYFEEHMKQKEIADYFKVSAEYVSKVVRNDFPMRPLGWLSPKEKLEEYMCKAK